MALPFHQRLPGPRAAMFAKRTFSPLIFADAIIDALRTNSCKSREIYNLPRYLPAIYFLNEGEGQWVINS